MPLNINNATGTPFLFCSCSDCLRYLQDLFYHYELQHGHPLEIVGPNEVLASKMTKEV